MLKTYNETLFRSCDILLECPETLLECRKILFECPETLFECRELHTAINIIVKRNSIYNETVPDTSNAHIMRV